MTNLKDILTTVFGILAAVAGGILTASTQGLVLPTWVLTICGIVAAVSVAIIGVLSGKNPNLTKKTDLQVEKANEGK